MSVDQTAFFKALLAPDRPVPEGLTDPEGRPAPKRFAVYRNNVAVSLTEALMTGFPVLVKLLGEENFRGIAGIFLRQHPPTSAVLMHYGRDLPGFLEGFAPLKHLPYLADVARLELALRESYHAADATPIDPDTLGSLAPDALVRARLGLAPALRLFRSRWPIHAIWAMNMEGGPKPQPGGQDVLVLRPEFDPRPHLLPPGGGAFMAALADGATLGAALDATGREDFDLGTTLGILLSGGAIVELTLED